MRNEKLIQENLNGTAVPTPTTFRDKTFLFETLFKFSFDSVYSPRTKIFKFITCILPFLFFSRSHIFNIFLYCLTTTTATNV